MIEKAFLASNRELHNVMNFVETQLAEAGCPPSTIFQIAVCVEEIFINIANYAYPHDEKEMTLAINTDEGVHDVILKFTDDGVPFNPLNRADPDITLPAEEREIGGLGIFMVKKTMDNLNYRRENGQNIFTISKQI